MTNFIRCNGFVRKFYGLYLKLKPGVSVIIKPTMRCNSNCENCCVDFILGRRPVFLEIGADQWIQLIERFPTYVKEVPISGGEPFIYRSLSELVAGLLAQGRFVCIYTNLSIYKQLPSSPRLKIWATYHEEMDVERFRVNLERFRRDGHKVRVKELSDHCVIKGSVPRTMMHASDENLDAIRSYPVFVFAPDGRLFIDHTDLEGAG